MNKRMILTGLVALSAMGLLAFDAGAQNALGGGNALDSNLGVGTGGINQPAAIPNFRDRNLLVTGDVIGGRGFRDIVGYRAAGDFTDPLGSNDLFRFRADSAVSSPHLFQLGTTYDQLRFGQSIGIVEYRRSASADPASMVARDPIVISEVTDPTMLRRVDRQTLINSLAFTEQQAVEPRVIGSTYSRDGALLYFNASPVRGIVVEPAAQSPATIGLSTYDVARILSDAISTRERVSIGSPFTTSFDELTVPGVTTPSIGSPDLTQPDLTTTTDEPTGKRVDREITSQHQQILERVVERYAAASRTGQPSTAQTLQDLGIGYEQLRKQLALRDVQSQTAVAQVEPTQPGWQLTPSPGEQQPGIDQFGMQQPGIQQPGTPGTQQPGTQQSGPFATRQSREDRGIPDPTRPVIPETQVRGLEQLTRPTTPESTATTPADQATIAGTREGRQRLLARPELTGALNHNVRLDQLSTTMQDRFNELVISAEKSLSEGDYFLAERRFERALRLVPGHPMASVGMAHAQLGAGLYLSASLTLRTLFAAQPEMIDVTYAPHLLPTTERMQAAVESIRERNTADTAARDRAAYGFLLAYIGHQTKNEALMREGLASMVEADADNPLIPLLEQIWLDEQGDSSAPSEAPASTGEPQK